MWNRWNITNDYFKLTMQALYYFIFQLKIKTFWHITRVLIRFGYVSFSDICTICCTIHDLHHLMRVPQSGRVTLKETFKVGYDFFWMASIQRLWIDARETVHHRSLCDRFANLSRCEFGNLRGAPLSLKMRKVRCSPRSYIWALKEWLRS